MAHRRSLCDRKLVGVSTSLLALFALLTVSVAVSNRVSDVRNEVARLEDRREVLETGNAGLLRDWNRETAPARIIARARVECVLFPPEDPGLVLVQLPDNGQRTSPWRRLVASVAGGDVVASADAAPAPIMGTMISLTPRQAADGRGGR